MTVQTRLADLLIQRQPGYSLPGPFYLDEDIFAADVAEIFGKHWFFAATVGEIPEPGDFITLDIAHYSIIIIRDDDENVRAFHNVCRHRGSRLLDDASGAVGNIVCPYHQWTYTPEGELIHAGSQAADFDPACFSLLSVHCTVVAGVIYVCLGKEPPTDFAEVARQIAPYIAPHELANTKVAAQVDLIEEGNWKLVMENNRECYHCEAGHPELLCTFFPTWGYAEEDIPKRLLPAHQRYLAAEELLKANCDRHGIPYQAIEDLRDRPTGFRIEREALDAAGESYTRDGKAASRKLLGAFDTPVMGRLTLHTQPNAWFHFLGDHIVTFSLVPISVDRTLVRTTWLVHADAVEGEDYDLHHLTEVWTATNKQDSAFVARAQLGVASPAYLPGPYAPHEYQVEDFVAWYIGRMRAGLGIADDVHAMGQAS